MDSNEAFVVEVEACRRVDDLALRRLARGDDGRVGGVEGRLALARDVPLLIERALAEERSVRRELRDAEAVLDLDAVGERVVELALARARPLAAAVDGHVLAAHAHGRARDVHRGVARADDGHAVAELVDLGVLQVVDGVGDIAEALAFDMEAARLPGAGADEDRVEAIGEEVVEVERLADRRVRADLDAERLQLRLIALEDGLRQAELRDAVAHHAADLVLALKDRDVVALLREAHGDGDARGARADDGDLLVLRWLALEHGPVEVGVGDVVLDARDLHGASLAALDAVALALRLVIADEGADDAHRIVREEHRARLAALAGEEQADHLGDIGLRGAAREAAKRFFALQAAARLVDNMYSHSTSFLFGLRVRISSFHITNTCS